MNGEFSDYNILPRACILLLSKVSGSFFSDLRMGIEGSYVFTFEVGKNTESGIEVSDFTQTENRPDLGQVSLLWDRIWEPTVSLTPEARVNTLPTE